MFFNNQDNTNSCDSIFSKASELWYNEKIIDQKADPKSHSDGTLISEIPDK